MMVRVRKHFALLLAAGLVQSLVAVAPVVAADTASPSGTTTTAVPNASPVTPSTPEAPVPSTATASSSGVPGVAPANDNSLIVQYQTVPSVSTQSSLAIQSSQSINVNSSTGTFHAQIMHFANLQAMNLAQATLKTNSNVISVTPNLVVYPQVAPNDPSYTDGTQWAPAAMKLPAAWDTTTGSASTVVAVLDTGVLLTHPDLVNNLWTNPAEIAGNNIDDDSDGYVDDVHGYNFVDNNGDPTDVLTYGGSPIQGAGHGTHVAGIIGAEGNNNLGVTGVNWHTSIMALRVCGPRYGSLVAGCYLDWILKALQYAYDHGAQVINESFGGAGAFATSERDMINAIAGPGTGLRKGALVVAAAGNSGVDTTNAPFYPAGYGLSNLMSVGALNPDGTLASFSNYGWNSVDVLAPGVNIYSTMVNGSFSGSGDYGQLSGTSMAAPEVSGLAALIYSVHPGWSPNQVKNDIISTSTWTPSLAADAFSGGIVNAQAALALVTPTDTLRMNFAGTGLGSLSIAGGATCTDDCNVPIPSGSLPPATMQVLATPTGNVSVTWQGGCRGTPAATPCTFTAGDPRPNVSAIFTQIGGSGIAQTPLSTSPGNLAQPPGSGPYDFNFVSTVITPSGTDRLKISHYWPPPLVGGWCSYTTSATGGVSLEHFDPSTGWTTKATFTSPALGATTPGSAGTVHWTQISNCYQYGITASISDDAKTVVIPVGGDFEVVAPADPTQDFMHCGFMVYKQSTGGTWDGGSLVEPSDESTCFKVLNRGASGWGVQSSMDFSSLSGDGKVVVLSGDSNQVSVVDLSGATPQFSAPYTLPNSCVNSTLGKTKVSKDGSLILVAVYGCSDNATALLLSNSGNSLALVRTFSDIQYSNSSWIVSLALAADGQTLALSYNQSGSQVLIYEKHSGTWLLERRLTSTNGLTNSLQCEGFSETGDRLVCGDPLYTVGYVTAIGMVETIDRISGSWSLGQPIPTIAWSDSGSSFDEFSSAGSNGLATTIDGVLGSSQLGDGIYPNPSYMGQTFTIPSQTFNNTVLPTLSGLLNSGSAITATTGTWTGFVSPTSTIQWLSCGDASDANLAGCVQIAGANSSTYTAVDGDVGKYLRVLVTLTQGVTIRSVYSEASGQVQPLGTAPAPAPTISGVSPTSGSTAGGTVITITGTGFAAGAIVTVGGAPATGVAIASTSITATTPAGTAGARDVVVTNADNQSVTGTGLFTYVVPVLTPAPAPTITGVTPTSGSSAGGTQITITGNDFVAGATVTVGGAPATGLAVTPTSITATTPAGTAGIVNIVVTNPDTQFATGTALFTYVATVVPPAPVLAPAPTITRVSPTSGPTGGGTSITITGTGFVAGATVSIGGVAATGLTITSTSITATTPAGTAGAKNIVVRNLDSQTVTGTGLFTYVAPVAPPAPAPTPPPVIKVTPTIVWPTPASISSDTSLSSTQLNASVNFPTNTPGTFSYSPALGTLLTAGTHTLSVVFTPDDQSRFEIARASVSIVVTPAPLQLLLTLTGLTVTYDGTPKSAGVDGLLPGVNYAITYDGSADAPTNAGDYAVVATITSDGYAGSATGTLTINRARPIFTWPSPQPITSDQFLTNLQLNATSSVPGTFTYTPPVGTKFTVGNQTLTASFIPVDQNNYFIVQLSNSLVVTPPPAINTPNGTPPPYFLANIAPTNGTTKLTPTQIKQTTTSAAKKGSIIQIFSYVKPTKNSAADLKLSLSRANEVKAQLIKTSPKAIFQIKAMGSTIQPSCAKTQNVCVIIKVINN